MCTSTLTDEGQVTIPETIREALQLQVGDQVEFLVEEGKVELRRAAADITELDGLLDRSNQESVTIDEMRIAIERASDRQS
jgi:AbrB family looped-hinge helix DNA binding protein